MAHHESETFLVTAPDNYADASSIFNTPVKRFILDVYNQGIYWQLQRNNQWEAVEVFMGPGSRAIIRSGLTGIRVRASIPAANLAGQTQALVNVEAVK